MLDASVQPIYAIMPSNDAADARLHDRWLKAQCASMPADLALHASAITKRQRARFMHNVQPPGGILSLDIRAFRRPYRVPTCVRIAL